MNTKKILAIFMCMLVIALIPVAAGAATNQTQDPQASGLIRHYSVVGIIAFKHDTNGQHSVTFRCVWVHFNAHDFGAKSTGVLRGLQKLTVDTKSNWHGSIYAHFIMGTFDGSFDF